MFDDGGTAFPCSQEIIQEGMSLRDYFASQALIGLLAKGNTPHDPKFDASCAYNMADAMIEERKPKYTIKQ